jgi:hypothetical protein
MPESKHPPLEIHDPDSYRDIELLSKFNKDKSWHLWMDNGYLPLEKASGTPGFDSLCWIAGMPEADKAAGRLS